MRYIMTREFCISVNPTTFVIIYAEVNCVTWQIVDFLLDENVLHSEVEMINVYKVN